MTQDTSSATLRNVSNQISLFLVCPPLLGSTAAINLPFHASSLILIRSSFANMEKVEIMQIKDSI